VILFFNIHAFGSRFFAFPADKRRGFGTTPALKCGACFYISAFLLLASCAGQAQTLPRVEQQRLIARHYDRLTPVQRKEFLSREFENTQAAEATLNSYVQKNRSETELLQRTAARMREIAEAWRSADRFIESVDSYLSGRKDSAEDLKRKGELDGQYIEVVNQLTNARTTIHHTPFEITRKTELLERNSDYRKRVDEAMKRLSKK
jgi:hypothetical protein